MASSDDARGGGADWADKASFDDADDSPVLDELTEMAEDRWSGELRVLKGPHLEGIVMTYRGRVAWAVAAAQHEDLGTFLWRLGRVTKEQLVDVRAEYERHQGSRKLGTLMEEAGLIRRPVLRRCLLLHARMAINSLLTLGEINVEKNAGEVELDPRMTFAIEEVLPERFGPLSQREVVGGDVPMHFEESDAGRTVLQVLEQIGGYLGAAVISTRGRVLFAHRRTSRIDPASFGIFLASALESCTQASVATKMGTIDALFIECGEGAMAARWVDKQRDHLAVVLVEGFGRIGSARLLLRNAAPEIERMLAEDAPPDSVRREVPYTGRQ